MTASYLVTARIKLEKLDELEDRLRTEAFEAYPEFGEILARSLKNARVLVDWTAIWEEESSCNPPLQKEREAVLDEYFEILAVKETEKDIGWEKIREIPRLFPDLR